MASWVSKDTSSPYYGQSVTVNDSGKIVPSSTVITTSKNSSGITTYTTPSGTTTTNEAQAVNETLMGLKQPTTYNVSIGDKSMNVSAALAQKIQGQTFYQDTATKEIYGSPSEIPTPAASTTPLYTLTSKGAAYTDTGQLVSVAANQQIKSNAFSFLAPAEQFIAKGAGDIETVYQRVVQPKLALAREADIAKQSADTAYFNFEQGGSYTPFAVARSKEMFAEFKSGAFNLITAPIETAAMIVGMKTLPAAGASELGPASGYATGVGLTVGIGIARNPQDPILGISRTTGEAAVLIAGSSALDMVGGKNIPKWGFEDVKYPGKVVERYTGSRYSSGDWELIPSKESPVIIPEGAANDIQAYKGLKLGQQDLFGVEYSASGNKFKFGTPDLKLTPAQVGSLELTGYTPGPSRTEANFAQDLADQIYPQGEYRKSRLIVDLIGNTEVTRSLESGRLFPEETRSLSQGGVDITKNFIRKEGGLAYGSFTAEPQLPEENSLGILRGTKPGEPIIGDIDVQLKVGDMATAAKAQSLLGKLSSTDVVRISPENPTLIESFKNGQWIHAVDIHSIDHPLDESVPLEGAWGYKFDKSNIFNPNPKIEGVESMSLSEFRTRKAASILTFREEGFAPEAHRVKDIPDFITSQEYLTTVGHPSDLPRINELKDLYGEDLASLGSGRVPIFRSPSPSGFGGFTPVSPAALITPKVTPSVMAASPSLGVYPSAPSLASVSIKKSVSPSANMSYSLSSASRSPSRSISPSISPSISMSPSTSFSPSISPSISLSLSPSPSRSISPSISPSPSRSSYQSPGSSLGYAVPELKIPTFQLPMQFFGKSKAKKVTFNPKYFASVEATAWGIKGKKPGKGELMTGLNIRPMVG